MGAGERVRTDKLTERKRIEKEEKAKKEQRSEEGTEKRRRNREAKKGQRSEEGTVSKEGSEKNRKRTEKGTAGAIPFLLVEKTGFLFFLLAMLLVSEKKATCKAGCRGTEQPQV